MKDVPMELPPGLTLGVICEREDPRDALVGVASFDDLPEGARLGTSSLRRSCQVMQQRPDLQIGFLRGNVNTRLAKLDAGEFDAIILACAGLKRLGFDDRIGAAIDEDFLLPAGGQGAVGIEYRESDSRVAELLAPITSSRLSLGAADCSMFNATEETDCGDLRLLLTFLRVPNAFWGGAFHAEEFPSRLPTADAMSAAVSASWMMTLERFMVCFDDWNKKV